MWVLTYVVVSVLFYSFRNRGTVWLYRNQNLGLSIPFPLLRTRFSRTWLCTIAEHSLFTDELASLSSHASPCKPSEADKLWIISTIFFSLSLSSDSDPGKFCVKFSFNSQNQEWDFLYLLNFHIWKWWEVVGIWKWSFSSKNSLFLISQLTIFEINLCQM